MSSNRRADKLVMVVLDGAADESYPELEDQTPLAASRMERLRGLAPRGRMGWLYPVSDRFVPESDTGAMALMGYDVLKDYRGRAPLEALAVGVRLKPGEICMRVNFAALGPDGVTLESRVCDDLSDDEAAELVAALEQGVRLPPSAWFNLTLLKGYRVLMVLGAGEPLGSLITNTDPMYLREGHFPIARTFGEDRIVRCRPMTPDPAAQRAADLVNSFCDRAARILADHPVNVRRSRTGAVQTNYVLMRDAGESLPDLPSLEQLHGLRLGSFCEMPAEGGLVKLLGMVPLPHPRGGNPETYYRELARATLEHLPEIDGVYVHIKGPDEAAHAGRPERKRDVLDLIDRTYIAGLLDGLDLERTVLVVTSDHASICRTRIHSADPVPLLLLVPGIPGDGLDRFDEAACRRGSLGGLQGRQLLPELVLPHVGSARA